MRIAISGFGRIGKSFLKAAIEQNVFGKDIEVIAINNRSSAEQHAHLFKYDSIYGRFKGKIEVKNGNLVIDGHEIKWIIESDPLKLPWKELNIDLVVDSTGAFRSKADAEKHIKAGAKMVLISAPAEGVDATVVLGVNDHIVNKGMTVFSLASCTTNCLAPVLKVVDSKWGIENGFLSTVHAYTSDQNLVDGSHKDLRRARAGAMNIIPTSTGAAKAIGEVLKPLSGIIDGLAFRVPVACGSMNDMTLLLKKEATKDEINAELKRASGEELKGILGYSEEELVSSDVIGTSYSSIVDSKLTKVKGRLVKICAWYDNEYGYSNRLVDFVRKLAKL
jgi:glyceraldehyde 3-phosphate dehydrogenase